MPIEKNKVVTLHYTLIDADNDLTLEKSGADAPMVYLHGAGNILAGLEQALEGKDSGDRLTVSLDPEQAYGRRDESLRQRLSAKYLKHAGKLKPGKIVRVQTEQGPRMVTVLKVGLKTVDVDANHPFAGRPLRFELEVVEVRDADADEKAHGHVHGPGGHAH
jgi:FKBP-type peptidyl-prolyl cis-trans isomerase SlyD